MSLSLAVLVCLCALARASDPPLSPWQALNPPLGGEADVYTPVENTYPEEYAIEDSFYEDEQQDDQYVSHVPDLPFKLPFKMDKKQVAVAMKLLKEAVKPILKSKTLREYFAYLDDTLSGYNGDIETQLYMRLALDSVQDLYEGKETTQLHKIFNEFFTDVSDEETARTMDTMWREYVSPTMRNWIYNPVRRYLVAPMRDLLYYPVSNAITEFADRIGRYLGGDSGSSYVNIEYPQYNRWSDTVSNFAKRLSDWTSQARNGIEVAARMLEAQDAAEEVARCGGSCHSTNLEEVDASSYNVEVVNLGWIGWLVGALVLAALVAAPAIAIPVALGVGLGVPLGIAGPTGPTGLTGPATAFIVPTAFVAGPPTGGFPPPVALPPGLPQVLANLPLTNRRFEVEESESELQFDDEDAYTHYSKHEYS